LFRTGFTNKNQTRFNLLLLLRSRAFFFLVLKIYTFKNSWNVFVFPLWISWSFWFTA
jgi:hypothetical protein